MKKVILIIITVCVLGVIFVLFSGKEAYTEVSSFEECVAAGNPVMESYPRQCRSEAGQVFTEEIGNEIEKNDLIRVSQPRPNAVVASPLTIRGEARGFWFFEASFPIQILDESGAVIAESFVQATDEWMTTEFVPFEATITFNKPTSLKGSLVLKKDNPSGLPENGDELIIPIVFNQEVAYEEPEKPLECVVTGCSGQICASEEVASTCEFREEYACYQTAVCEVQSSGECGWTETDELAACIEDANSPQA